MRRTVTYDGSTGTIAAARDFAAAFLEETQADRGVPVTPALLGSVKLVVSELVTNAGKYAPGPCLVELALYGDELVITVEDTEVNSPSPRSPDPRRVGRHGLEIVLALCERYEVERRAGGKHVRVTMTVE